MKAIHFDDENNRIYWSLSDDSSYIQVGVDLDCSNTFTVMYVPQYGGAPVLDSHCNNIEDAMFQLEMVSV